MIKDMIDDFSLEDTVLMYEVYLEGIIGGHPNEKSYTHLLDSGYTEYAEAEKCADYAFDNYDYPAEIKLPRITIYSVLVHKDGQQEVLDCCYEKRLDKIHRKAIYF